jgi:YD repeat-containing protein
VSFSPVKVPKSSIGPHLTINISTTGNRRHRPRLRSRLSVRSRIERSIAAVECKREGSVLGSVLTIDTAGNQWRVQVEPAYDDSGNRPLSAHKFDYDDRIVEEATGMFQAPNGSWNAGPDTEVHNYSYDANGNKQTYTDPQGRQTTYTYDDRNRPWQTIEYPISGASSAPRITENNYDAAGNKNWVKFPDQWTQHWLYYDGFGQPRQFIDEGANVTDFNYWPWGPMKGQLVGSRLNI